MKEQISASGSIVLYKNNLAVEKVIQSFLQVPFATKLYLVDNSPTNVLQRTLQKWISDKRVEYIFNDKNVGYGSGHNRAMKRSLREGFSYHFIFNPDVEFKPEAVVAICSYMQSHPDAGLVMPKIVYPNGDTQFLCKLLPTPFDLFIRRFVPDRFAEFRTNRFELRETGYNKTMEVPFLSGCFMSLRREAIEQCGMFDERFFMYGEDIDFSRRIHEKFRTVYYPHVAITHGYEAASYKSFKMLVIHTINIIRYFNKWGWFFDMKRRKINQKILALLKN